MKIPQPNDEPQKAAFWAIWIAMIAGLPIMQFVAMGGWPSGSNQEGHSVGLFLIALSGITASSVIRWVVLPRIKKPQSLMTTMVAGLALAESTALLGMFFISSDFPETQQATFILSLLGMLQFIPTYAADLE